MDHLLPCPGCSRHVRAVEPLCPFCGEALPLSLRERTPRLPTRRLGRSATFAFGAALAASACGEAHTPEQDGSVAVDSGSRIDEDAGPNAQDAGSTAPDAGEALDAGPAPTPDAGGGVVPAYGAPAPVDAGMANPPDAGGGVTPLYGGSPAD